MDYGAKRSDCCCSASCSLLPEAYNTTWVSAEGPGGSATVNDEPFFPVEARRPADCSGNQPNMIPEKSDSSPASLAPCRPTPKPSQLIPLAAALCQVAQTKAGMPDQAPLGTGHRAG